MNRRIIMVVVALLLIGAFLCCPRAEALPGPDSPKAAPGNGHRIEKMRVQLNLNEEQTLKLDAALKELRSKSQAENTTYQAKVRALLTPEQQAKFDVLKAEHKQNFRQPQQQKSGGIAQELSLTPEQQARYNKLSAEHRETRKSNREAFNSNLKSFLTPEQWEKYQQMKQRRHGQGKAPGPGAGPSPSASPGGNK